MTLRPPSLLAKADNAASADSADASANARPTPPHSAASARHRLYLQSFLVSAAAASESWIVLIWSLGVTQLSEMTRVHAYLPLVAILLLAPRLGARADRRDPGRMLVRLLIASGVFTCLNALVVFFGSHEHEDPFRSPLFLLFLALIACRVCAAAGVPALHDVALTRLGDDEYLLRSRSSLALSLKLSGAVGPVVAGIAMPTLGFTPALALCGLVTIGAAFIYRGPVPGPAPEAGTPDSSATRRESAWKTVKAQVQAVPLLGAHLLLFCGPILFVLPYLGMLPTFTGSILGPDFLERFAHISGAISGGALAGLMLLRWVLPARPTVIAVVCALASSLTVIWIGAYGVLSVPAVVLTIALTAAVGEVFRVASTTRMLVLADPAKRGALAGVLTVAEVLSKVSLQFFGTLAITVGWGPVAGIMAVLNLAVCMAAAVCVAKYR